MKTDKQSFIFKSCAATCALLFKLRKCDEVVRPRFILFCKTLRDHLTLGESYTMVVMEVELM
jgi:hypothetical protein